MNTYLLISGCLALVLGGIHSILGEFLIFRHLKESYIFSDDESSKLKKRYLNTLWSTWHLVTIFGWGFGAILIVLSFSEFPERALNDILLVVSVTFLVSAVYWLFGTKGKHPAWIILAFISFLVLCSDMAG